MNLLNYRLSKVVCFISLIISLGACDSISDENASPDSSQTKAQIEKPSYSESIDLDSEENGVTNLVEPDSIDLVGMRECLTRCELSVTITVRSLGPQVRVYRSTTGVFDPQENTLVVDTILEDTTTMKHIDSGLLPGDTYTYFAVSANSKGRSKPISSEMSFSSWDLNPTLDDVNENELHLSWSDDYAGVTFKLTRESRSGVTEIVYQGNKNSFIDDLRDIDTNKIKYHLSASTESGKLLSEASINTVLLSDKNSSESIVTLASSFSDSMALTNKGNIWTWGANGNGESGLGHKNIVNRPKKVDFPVEDGASIIDIQAGGGFSMALDSKGAIWTWGGAGRGQLGNGKPKKAVTTPEKLGVDAFFSRISAGNSHAIALDSRGCVWTWGKDWTVDEDHINYTPKQIDKQVFQDAKIVSIAAGERFSLLLDNQGSVWSWGYNMRGQLGNGSTKSSNRPAIISSESFNHRKIISIDAGSQYSLAIDDSGALWQWGVVQKQYNDSEKNTLPSLIESQKFSGEKFVDAKTGSSYSLALDEHGKLWSWGSNTFGMLAQGSQFAWRRLPHLTNLPKMNGAKVAKIYTGGIQAYLVDTNNHLWAWGNDDYLGNGDDARLSGFARIVFPQDNNE